MKYTTGSRRMRYSPQFLFSIYALSRCLKSQLFVLFSVTFRGCSLTLIFAVFCLYLPGRDSGIFKRKGKQLGELGVASMEVLLLLFEISLCQDFKEIFLLLFIFVCANYVIFYVGQSASFSLEWPIPALALPNSYSADFFCLNPAGNSLSLVAIDSAVVIRFSITGSRFQKHHVCLCFPAGKPL